MPMKGAKGYSTIRVPTELAQNADILIGKYGFSSRAEVFKTAVRDLFEKYPETRVSKATAAQED